MPDLSVLSLMEDANLKQNIVLKQALCPAQSGAQQIKVLSVTG